MIKMDFLEHFQQNNQTLENIFQSIFWNATKYLKIFSFLENRENILHEPNTTLTLIFIVSIYLLLIRLKTLYFISH